jgi:hypothetical protein
VVGLLQVNCVARLVSPLTAMREGACSGGSSGAAQSEEEERESGKHAARGECMRRLTAWFCLSAARAMLR